MNELNETLPKIGLINHGIIRAITTYSPPLNFKTFAMNDIEIIDEIIDIRLPMQKIFGW